MKNLATFCLWLYSLMAMIWVWITPKNRFEWMLEDPALKTEILSYCALPMDDLTEGRLLTVLVITPIAFIAVVLSVKFKKMHFSAWISLVLFAAWALRFFVLLPTCP